MIPNVAEELAIKATYNEAQRQSGAKGERNMTRMAQYNERPSSFTSFSYTAHIHHTPTSNFSSYTFTTNHKVIMSEKPSTQSAGSIAARLTNWTDKDTRAFIDSQAGRMSEYQDPLPTDLRFKNPYSESGDVSPCPKATLSGHTSVQE